MGFLSGFVGGMAGAYNDDRDAEKLDARKRAMAEYENELRAKSQATAEALREKFEQAKAQAKRTQDMTDAKTVQEDAKQIDTDRSIGLINATVGPVPNEGEFAGQKMTAADIATIRNNMKPEDAKKHYGIEPLSREQRAEDSGVAAQGRGLLAMAKDYRADANQYRLQASDEAKAKRMADQDAATNKRLDNADAYNTKHLDEIIRHNKKSEALAAAKTGAEKLSPAAKAALELASNGLATAQIELKQAVNEQSKVQTKEYSDQEQKKLDMAAADSKYAMAKKGISDAAKHYNNTMSTYLEGYKPVGGSEPQKQPVTITLPSGGKLVIGEASTNEEAIAIKKKFDSDNAERNKGKPQADIVGSQKGEVAIPMEFVRRSNGDPVMARKLFEEDELNKLSSAIPKNQSLVNTRHYMAPR